MNRRKTAPPRGVLSTAAADPGRYAHARYHPSPDLEPFVEHYWSVRWDLDGVAPERAETLPHPSVHMIFEAHAGSRIAGVTRGKFSRLLSGKGSVIAAKFKPGGFYPFAQLPVSTFTNRTLPLTEVFGDAGDAVTERVDAVSDDAARLAVIEDFLRSRRPRRDELAERVATIVYAVAGTRTILRVEDLVERYKLNVRALQRLFAKYVGVSPKWVIQRYRLHEAAEVLGGTQAVDHVALALALGYSDQAHFVRDFKGMVGMPPAAYARRARER
jgi:AraC-like DNA-binding protein